MKSGLNTIITLKEDYLKTLKDGAYSFEAIFTKAIIPLKLHVVTHKVNLSDACFTFGVWSGSGTAAVNLTGGMFSYEYYPELFEGVWYKGEKLNNSCYIIRKFQNVTTIILKEEYIKTLSNGVHYFTAEFMTKSENYGDSCSLIYKKRYYFLGVIYFLAFSTFNIFPFLCVSLSITWCSCGE